MSLKSTQQDKIYSDSEWIAMQNLVEYKGQWIAILDKQIIARDESLKQVKKEVASQALDRTPLYIQIPKSSVTANC